MVWDAVSTLTGKVSGAQKGLDKKFSQGDLKPADYKARLQEAKQAVNYAAAMSQNTANTLTPRVFAHGAEQSPWNNAAVAVRYGAVIAAPLMVLSIVRTVRHSRSWFPILDLTYALIASVIGWLVTAAVFGYFYHRIRGRNGFEKGAYAFEAVTPSIPLRLLAGELPTTSAQLVSMVEVFAFVLVLALVAFDLRVLQRCRHG